MIPKIIHYCWFGKNRLPKYAEKNINSWKRYLNDFEVKEWNESNFDVNIIPYTQEAYKQKKYAFVSDFARYWILYKFGGIYFDTDVEVIKPFTDILEKGPFLGIEKDRDLISVAPGLGMGAHPKMDFYKKIIDSYSSIRIIPSAPIKPHLISATTSVLEQNGFKKEDKLQFVDDIWIYPNEFFNPLDDYIGKINLTENTRSIHYYAKSWIENYGPVRNYISRLYHRLLKP